MRGWQCRKSWALEKEESTFIDWQRAKVQETTDEVRITGHRVLYLHHFSFLHGQIDMPLHVFVTTHVLR